jgi:hypothetical protein
MSALLAFIRADPTLDMPLVPGSWDVIVESNRWATIWPQGRGGIFFHARLIARQSGTPTHALFVCTGAANVLTALANQIAADGLGFTQTWANLPALRADAGATATAAKAAWPDERPHTFSGTNTAPVDGGPIGVLVALYGRMAGFNAEDAET